MLQEIGYSSIEDLFAHIPEEVKLKGELNIPNGKSEFEVRREMEQIAEKTRCSRRSSEEPELQTFYPGNGKKCDIQRKPADGIYAISGRNQSGNLYSRFFEYQTMICDLTGMDVSMHLYMTVQLQRQKVLRCQDRKRHKALISGTVPPYVLEVVETYCFGNGMELEVIPEKTD